MENSNPLKKFESGFVIGCWHKWIGTVVSKKSNKKFKSDKHQNTITGVVIHPITDNSAFTFAEDDSVVECRTVLPVEGRLAWESSPSWAIGQVFSMEKQEWVWVPLAGFNTEDKPYAYNELYVGFKIIPSEYWHRLDESVKAHFNVNVEYVASMRSQRNGYRQPR